VVVSDAKVAGEGGVDARLLHTSGSCLVAGLVHSSLQLLKETVNILEIVLGASIGQWE